MGEKMKEIITKMKEEKVEAEIQEAKKTKLRKKVRTLKEEVRDLRGELKKCKNEGFVHEKLDVMGLGELRRLAEKIQKAVIDVRVQIDKRCEYESVCTVCLDRKKNCTLFCGHRFCLKCANRVAK